MLRKIFTYVFGKRKMLTLRHVMLRYVRVENERKVLGYGTHSQQDNLLSSIFLGHAFPLKHTHLMGVTSNMYCIHTLCR